MTKKTLPKGTIRIHLYSVKNVLRPRGGIMQKESLSLAVYERLTGAYEDWTDPNYGDNPERDELIKLLGKNLMEEVETAWKKFNREIDAKEKKNGI